MNDHIVGACQHYLAMAKDPNSKPRHVNNARAELIAVLCRGMTDAEIAECMAWGKAAVRHQFAAHEANH